MSIQSQPAAPSGPPSTTGEALAMVSAGLGYLAACDPTGLPAAAQAEALIGLEHAEARHTAARARILSAFTTSGGYHADGQYGPRPWLRAFTKVTKTAAAATAAWAKRLEAHPAVAAALASAQISVSWAREICSWTDQLPADHRGDCDVILLAAAAGGADLRDLAALAREMIDRSRTTPDPDTPGRFADRAVWLETTLAGAGRLAGDLTPAAAAALTAVLDALAAKTGPEDTRSLPQRRHDALEEACHRLIAARMVPGRDGQPLHLQVHADLAALAGLPGASALEAGWSPARNAVTPGSCYLPGAEAEAAACDATIIPVVTGQIDWALLDHLTRLYLKDMHARAHGPGGRQDGAQDGRAASGPASWPGQANPGGPTATGPTGLPAGPGGVPFPPGTSTAAGSTPLPGTGLPAGPGGVPFPPSTSTSTGTGDGTVSGDGSWTGCACPTCGPVPDATLQRLQHTLIRTAVSLLSGPGGLAAQLRTRLLDRPYTSCSQPLDLGAPTPEIPANLRRAVILRDRCCSFPGCWQPPAVCQVHHLLARSKGGPTALGNLKLLCRFHHLIVIHRWGWSLTCHPDGTTTATSPNGRVLHSHGPPSQTA